MKAPATVAALAALLLSAAASHAAIIDTFNAVEGGNPDSVSRATPGTSSTDFTISPTVTDPVGSRRRLEVGQFTSGQSSSLTIDGTSGVAALTSSAGGTSTWTIIYGIGFPQINFDATDGGASFAFRLNFSDVVSSLEYTMQAFSTTGGGTAWAGTYKPVTAGNIDVPFSTFSNLANINFTSLTEIDIRVRDAGLSHGGNANLTQVETVPEPTSGAMLAFASMGVFLLRRRRQVS